MSKKFLLIALMVVFVATAQAAWNGACEWTYGATPDQDYHTGGNWTVFEGPMVGQNIAPVNDANEYDAFIAQNGAGPIVTQDVTVNVVGMGGAAWKGQAPVMDANFTIQSGNMSTIWWFVIGEQFGSNGTLNMSGGSLTVDTDLMIGAHDGGSGTLNMTGGSMDIYQLFSAFYATPTQKPEQSGMINLDGGTIHVRTALVLNNQGKMNITGGTLTLDGDSRWGMSDLSSWTLLEAYSGAGSILFSYDSVADLTTVTATTDAMYIDKFDTYADDVVLQAVWDDSSANATITLGPGHADGNSLLLAYDNTAVPYVAETFKTFAPAKDFTLNGAISTDLWFWGQAGNSVEQIYIILEDGTGATQTIDYDGDINDITAGGTGGPDPINWTVSYGNITVDLTDIVKYTIGIGNGIAGGTGSVIFDSAMMYGPRGGGLQADLNSDSRVDLVDFGIMASEWLEVAL